MYVEASGVGGEVVSVVEKLRLTVQCVDSGSPVGLIQVNLRARMRK